MRKNLLRLCALCLSLFTLFPIFGCGGAEPSSEHPSDWMPSFSDEAESSESGSTETRLLVTGFTSPVSLNAADLTEWLQGDDKTLISEAVSASVSDRGVPVTIGYQMQNLSGRTVSSAEVRVAKSGESLDNATAIKIAKNKTSASVYNLIPDTSYTFSLKVTLSDQTEMTEQGSFTTADGVRFIYAQNGVNMREVGGWHTEDGKTIKHGMLFRGGELDGKVESSFLLNYKGVRTLHDELGIRYDMDLRAAGGDTSATSIIGEDVPRKYYDLSYYQSATTTASGQAKLKEVFTDLANPSNYPVYIHCTYGTDRTGTVLAILECLLGMSKADVIREYELTYLYFNHVNRNYGNANGDTFLKLLASIEQTEGATLAEKTANLLKKAGVTQAQIDSIRSILLSE